ncbi:MAG: hypothetical protein MJY56_05450 [Bacteroidales bacterium]|nr:hypothetical protein [Bacteroidales bacterium]
MILEYIKNRFRARALRKYAYSEATGLRPLRSVRTAAVLLDVQNQGFEPLKQQVLDWFKSHGIKAEPYYFDFRKIEKEEMLLTSMKTTYIRRELNWYGSLSPERIEPIVENRPFDLFISLVPDAEFPTKLLSSSLPASFKVGLCGYEGAPYDLVVSAPTPAQGFGVITDILEKIQ